MVTDSEKQIIEDIVKNLILEKINSKITDIDIKSRGVSKSDVAQSFLTDIMALGYNNSSKELAAKDIWKLQSQMPWTNIKKSDILNRINVSATKFKIETDCFMTMINDISNGNDKKTILDNVKRTLG